MYVLKTILLAIIIITIGLTIGEALKCRSEDGPSDGELKRVARSCMRKFGDINFAQNSQHQQQYNQQHQQIQGSYSQRVYNTENRGYHYEGSEENDNYDFDDDQFYNNNNNRNNNRQQYGNNNNNYNNNNRNGHNGNNNNGGGHNDDRQRNRNRYNQNRTQNENNNNYWNYSNQRTSNRESNSNYNNSNRNKHNSYNNNNQNNQSNSSSDVNCIVHCFFNEMHMLNNDDYPDRHKMLYILTKDMRDRELRNFYTDTIQECFRYLENQRRRDKCQFSRDLITCMTEYAKGNCDDWNEFNMMFN